MAAADYTSLVQQIYISYFGRPADTLGLANYAAQLNTLGAPTTLSELITAAQTNTSLSTLINSFGASAESIALYGTDTVTFVSAVYSNVLNRVADFEGLLYWAGEIDAGHITKANAALIIAQGALDNTTEQGLIDAAVLTNKTAVAVAFTASIDSAAELIAYAGDDAAATARALLQTVTNETVAADFQDAIDTTVAQLVTDNVPVVVSQTLTLTTGVDAGSSFTGGAGDDTFNAAYTGTAMTFGASDALNGGAGTDTLNVGIGAAGIYQASSLTNIENVVANFSAAGTLSLLGSTGVTAVSIQGPTADATVSGITSTATTIAVTNINDTGTDLTLGYASSAVSGSSDSALITLSSVVAGTLTLPSVESLHITSSAAANTITTLTAAAGSELVITGDQTFTITNNLTVVDTVDASASTGKIDLDFETAATVTGGSNNDVLSFETNTGDVSVSGGAGNDSLTFTAAAVFDADDTISGGAGTDTLTIVSADATGYSAGSTATMTGFETLKISDALAASLDVTELQTGLTTVNLAGGSGAFGLTMDAGTQTVLLGAANTGNFAVTDTGSATTDAVTIKTNAAGIDGLAGFTLTSTGYETVTIYTGSDEATDQTVGAVTITADTGGTATLNFTGTNNVTLASSSADVINASGMTADGALTITTGTTGVEQTITGTANADTLRGATDSANVITGGAGKDTIVGGSDDDSISGGDGNDNITTGAGDETVTGGAGNDTIILGADYTSGDSLDGGDGTDTLSITTAAATTLSGLSISAITALNAITTGIERVTFSDQFNVGSSFDMARLDGINYITLADGINGDETFSGLAANSTVVVNADNNANTDILTLSLTDATGSADTLNYSMVQAASADYGVLAVSGIETLNISVSEATADSTVRVATLGLNITTATAGTTVNFSGTESYTIDTVIAAQTITSTTTGAFVMTNTTGSGLSQTFTTGAGADTIYAGGGVDTISTGSGADSIIAGSGADVITAGNGADTIDGGSGNDTITLTETTAAVDDVILNYSELGANVDTIVGFTTTSSGDEIQLDLSALETAGTSGVFSSAVNFVENDTDDTSDGVGAGAASVQVLTAAATLTDEVNLLVLSGSVFGSADEVEDALESGGAFAITASTTGGTPSFTNANNAFIVVWSDGTNAHVSAVHVVTETTDNAVFETGDLNVIDLATISGVATIGSSTFAAGNFEWIA